MQQCIGNVCIDGDWGGIERWGRLFAEDKSKENRRKMRAINRQRDCNTPLSFFLFYFMTFCASLLLLHHHAGDTLPVGSIRRE
jgi:hypothetical protein